MNSRILIITRCCRSTVLVDFVVCLCSVWEHCTARGRVERTQRHRESSTERVLFRGRDQQQQLHSAAPGQSERPRKDGENSAEMAS